VLIPVCFVIISDIGTDESDVDTEEDIQPAPGRNAYPWFSVINRETFQLSVEGFVAGTDSTDQHMQDRHSGNP
jgi:hypothetical protein